MRVLLIMPYHCDLIHAVSLPLGILSIASYLEKNGYEVKPKEFMRISVPFTLAAVTVGYVFLWVFWR